MYDNKYSSVSEKISAFVDGELPSEHSADFFYEIASNSDYQEELRQMLVVKDMSKKTLMVAPDHLKMQILNNIGLVPKPVSTLTKMSTGATGLLALLFKNKVTHMAGTAILASLITIFFFSADPEIMEMTSGKRYSSPVEEIRYIPVSSSIENDNIVETSVPVITPDTYASSGIFSKHWNLNKPNYLSGSNLANASNTIPSDSEANYAFIPIDINNVDQRNIDIIRSNEQPSEIGALYSGLDFGAYLDRLSISFRYFQTKSFVDQEVDPLSDLALNNIAMSLTYLVDDYSSFGIEVGQENFIQNYEGVVEGEFRSIYQNYTTFWAGIMYKYNFTDPMASIRPSYSMTFGATKVGPLLRTAVLADLFPSTRYSFFVGAEASMLIYQYQGRNFTTTKLGLTAGISLKL